MTKLTPDTFDGLTRGPAPAREERIIWTAAAIGRRIGRSEDYVRKTLAKRPDTPIQLDGTRLYAFEDALVGYMRNQKPE